MSTEQEQRASLVAAVENEHAAVFSYGVIAAYARDETRARRDLASHRARRQAGIDLLRQLSANVPVAAAGYTLPFPVRNAEDARSLAVVVETGAAKTWLAVAEHAVTEDIRRVGIDGVGEAAVRLGRWRIEGGAPVDSLPGMG
jgi:hypothetical protein